MSKSESKELERRVIDERRHQTANVPMEFPDDAYEVVPGIFVASLKALPRLIEFFNVRTIVRCIEHEPKPEECLRDLGGDEEHPYGSVILKKNIFHCPLRDSLDETDFPQQASKAANFIANILTPDEDFVIGGGGGDAGEASGGEQQQEDDDGEDEQKADDEEKQADSSKSADGEAKKPMMNAVEVAGAVARAACAKNDDDDDDDKKNNSDEQQQNQQQQEQEQHDDQVDPFMMMRSRGPGAVAIHCEAGRSRSPAVAIAFLVLKRQMNLQEALEMFDGDEDAGLPQYKLQINPVFVAQLAEMESNVYGQRIFDLHGYWVKRLSELFPKIPASTISSQLEAAQGNMLVAREKLMTMAARQFFDRDQLMIDALFDICCKTSEDFKAGINMAWRSSDPVVSKAEVEAAYRESGKKRDVALMQLTKTIRARMTIE